MNGLHALAECFEGIAKGLRTLPPIQAHQPVPMLQGEHAVGAAVLWGCLRDLVTVAEKDVFSKGDILVLLDHLQQDPALCVPNSMYLINEALEEEVAAQKGSI
jgi:hypothetical protein